MLSYFQTNLNKSSGVTVLIGVRETISMTLSRSHRNVYRIMLRSDGEFEEAFDKYFNATDKSKLPYDVCCNHPLLHELFEQVARGIDCPTPRSQYLRKLQYVLSHKYYANLFYGGKCSQCSEPESVSVSDSDKNVRIVCGFRSYRDEYGYTPEKRFEVAGKYLSDYSVMKDGFVLAIENAH